MKSPDLKEGWRNRICPVFSFQVALGSSKSSILITDEGMGMPERQQIKLPQVRGNQLAPKGRYSRGPLETSWSEYPLLSPTFSPPPWVGAGVWTLERGLDYGVHDSSLHSVRACLVLIPSPFSAHDNRHSWDPERGLGEGTGMLGGHHELNSWENRLWDLCAGSALDMVLGSTTVGLWWMKEGKLNRKKETAIEDAAKTSIYPVGNSGLTQV